MRLAGLEGAPPGGSRPIASGMPTPTGEGGTAGGAELSGAVADGVQAPVLIPSAGLRNVAASTAGVPADSPAFAVPPVPIESGEGPRAVPAPELPFSTSGPSGVPRTAGSETLETQIGARWLLYLGVATLVLGLSYFIKYAFDNDWIAPPVRVLLGLSAGLGLAGAGWHFVARGLPQFGQALTGGGIGTLYLSLYAAHHWYGLVDRGPTFVAMAAVTLAGAVLADRQRSQPLAILSIAVGFLVPFLVGGGARSQVTLFTYDVILVCGTLYLARRRAWPALVLVSYALTLVTLYGWATRDYDRREYWITELFLTLFLVLFLRVRHENQRAEGPMASLTSVLLAIFPVIYHIGSLAILRPHRLALFVYLIGFSVAGTIAAGHLRQPWLRLLVWLGAAAPCLDIASGRVAPGWLPGAWITIVAIFGVHLISQIQALDDERPAMPAPEIVLLHGHGLWMLACLWALASPRALVSVPTLAFGLAALYGGLAVAGRRWHTEAALHATALSAALVAVAVALEFRGPWLAVSLAAEGAAIAYLGLRAGRGWLRGAGLGLLLVATLLAADRLATAAAVNVWPVLNARTLTSLFVVAMLFATAALHRRARTPARAGIVAMLVIVGHVLVLAVISSEVTAFFAARAWAIGERPGAIGSSWLALQLTLSLAWASYAVALVAAGLRWRYRPIRYLAIGLFAVTMAKVFFVDLARLDRVFRMLSVIGLGLLLLLASYLYQRLRALDDEPVESVPSAEPPPDHDSPVAT